MSAGERILPVPAAITSRTVGLCQTPVATAEATILRAQTAVGSFLGCGLWTSVAHAMPWPGMIALQTASVSGAGQQELIFVEFALATIPLALTATMCRMETVSSISAVLATTIFATTVKSTVLGYGVARRPLQIVEYVAGMRLYVPIVPVSSMGLLESTTVACATLIVMESVAWTAPALGVEQQRWDRVEYVEAQRLNAVASQCYGQLQCLLKGVLV